MRPTQNKLNRILTMRCLTKQFSGDSFVRLYYYRIIRPFFVSLLTENSLQAGIPLSSNNFMTAMFFLFKEDEKKHTQKKITKTHTHKAPSIYQITCWLFLVWKLVSPPHRKHAEK